MKALAAATLFCFFVINLTWAEEPKPPINLAVIGLSHDAVGDFISRLTHDHDVQLVGIVESNQVLVTRYARLFNLSTNFFEPSLEDLLAKTNVQAAAVFTSTFDHRRVVENCAAHKIDVMLEKPLAVDMEAALAMAAAAKQNDIQIIVDYETSWFSSIQTAYAIADDRHAIGDLRKISVTAGDKGPKEAGCSDTFLDWLTDPALNGGGALTDFGCYGADLITWFMKGQRPDAVFAVAQHIKPDIYPKVEDEATIVVTYPQAQGIIQASWDLPFAERSMKIYGSTGYVFAPRMDLLQLRLPDTEESDLNLQAQAESDDDISYFAAIVRGDVKATGPSSLQINLITTEILDAARKSIQLGKQINLPQNPSW
ncbi:MAG TPA: Gfo/Idh/MocA family oxidoreductase [Candidatus Saccharimonadales bacterium]|nr:Gfo/Idh/MocA family oxidoreductase [Candidatus Saccharimonadales bacterium]